MKRRIDHDENPPCVCGHDLASNQCTECAVWLCKDCTRTCIDCKEAICGEHTKTVRIFGCTDELCPACVAKHRCSEWADLSYAGSATEPHGESHWDETYQCMVCGSKLSERDLEMAA